MWWSQRRLAEELGVAERSVKRSLARLRTLGFLHVKTDRSCKDKSKNTYKLALQHVVVTKANLKELASGDSTVPEHGTTESPSTGPQSPPNHDEGNHEEWNHIPPASRAAPSGGRLTPAHCFALGREHLGDRSAGGLVTQLLEQFETADAYDTLLAARDYSDDPRERRKWLADVIAGRELPPDTDEAKQADRLGLVPGQSQQQELECLTPF